jgi:hypothetical protein
LDDDAVDELFRLRWTRRESWGFMIGSALFALGAALAGLSSLPVRLIGATFFLGSVFFTTAAWIQLSLTDRAVARGEWWSGFIQFLGTLLFNVNTARATLFIDVSAVAADRLIWVPDAIGSAAFLISSAMAMAPEVRERRHRHVRGRSWYIAAINLLGSVFFGLSALGAFVLPKTNALVSVRWSNLGTFLGALCFLAGAALLLPRRATGANRGLRDSMVI